MDDDGLHQQRFVCAQKLREEREALVVFIHTRFYESTTTQSNPQQPCDSCDKSGQGETLQAAVEFVRPSGRKKDDGTNLVSSEWLEWNPPGSARQGTGDGR